MLLLPLGLALQLVVVARILHLKLVELALGTVAVAAAPLPGLLLGLLAGDAKLILAQFLQVLQGSLLLDDRPGKRLAKRIAAGVPRLRQAVGGGLHRLVGLVRLAAGLGVLQQRRRLLEQADQFLLRIEHDPNVVGQFFVVGIAALQVPCGADDLFLRVEHVGDGLLLFAALLAALALLLLLPHALGSGTVLPEDFLERPYGGEIQIAESPAHPAVPDAVVGPQEIAHHLPHLDAQILHAQHMGDVEPVRGQAVSAQRNVLWLLAGQLVADTGIGQPEVVARLAVQPHLLDRRNLSVAGRRLELERRGDILEHGEHVPGWGLILASLGILEVQLVSELARLVEVTQELVLRAAVGQRL